MDPSCQADQGRERAEPDPVAPRPQAASPQPVEGPDLSHKLGDDAGRHERLDALIEPSLHGHRLQETERSGDHGLKDFIMLR